MRLYAISGLGADERVFQYLNLDVELIPLKWLDPDKRESLESYARRMAKLIDTKQPFGIIGVSFGGIISVELTKIINPQLTILVSSIERSKELPFLYRLFGKTRMIEVLPLPFFRIPPRIAQYFFGSTNRKLLETILADSDLKFTKWALSMLLRWKSDHQVQNCLKIGGSKDKLLPVKDPDGTKIISGGGHFMIVDRSDEISEIINENLST